VGVEDVMKLSQEFDNRQQAEARERLLKAAGHEAWTKIAPDGTWKVFWMLKPQQSELSRSLTAA
jgi:hypothetical protein